MAEALEIRRLLATIVVDSVGNADGADHGIALSLRQAIEINNGTLPIASLSTSQRALVSGPLTSPNTIQFAIPGPGPFRITPATAMPAVTAQVIIDGYSQAGASPNTNGLNQPDNARIRIEVDGAPALNGAGLTISASKSTVRGLALDGSTFVDNNNQTETNPGLLLTGPSALVEGNFIGTDVTGTLAGVAGGAGISVNGGNYSQIGGTTPAARNLISGNSGPGISTIQRFVTVPGYDESSGYYVLSSIAVEGNFIGTDASGSRPLPNMFGILLSSSGNTIGGFAAGAGNVISGNTRDGIDFVSSGGSVVTDNLIGTDASGSAPLGNGGDGVRLGASGNRIGEDYGGGNVIAYNRQSGIDVQEVAQNNSRNLLSNGIFSNSIDHNGGLGIDRGGDGVTRNVAGNDPEAAANAPVLHSASVFGGLTMVSGTLDAIASTEYQVEVFTSPAADPSGFGQGQTDLGIVNVTTDVNGHVAFFFNENLDLTGQSISATATTTVPLVTSEFSRDLIVGGVAPVATSVAISSDQPGRSSVGQPVTFTAIVLAPAGSGTPTGPVLFEVDGLPGPLVSLRAVGGRFEATLTLLSLTKGTHTVGAIYYGDKSYAESTAPTLAQQVDPLASTITLSASPSPAIAFQPVTITGTVSGPPGSPVPTGSVRITDSASGANPGDLVNLDASGHFSDSFFLLSAGTHVYTATYSGDNLHDQVISTSDPLVGERLATSIYVSAAPHSTFGEPARIAAVLSDLAHPSAVLHDPTGLVTFTIDGVARSPIDVADSFGFVSLTTSALSVGPHEIGMAYSGDANFGPSSALPTTVLVIDPAPTTATLDLPSTAGSIPGDITLTGSVSASAASGIPTGSVEVLEDGMPIAFGSSSASLDTSGRFALKVPHQFAGSHVFTVSYAGDPNHEPSTSSLENLNFVPISPVVSAMVPGQSRFGEPVDGLIIDSGPAGAPSPSGPIQLLVDGVPLPASEITQVAGRGSATLRIEGLAPGIHTLTVSSGGDAYYGPNLAVLAPLLVVASTTSTLAIFPTSPASGQPLALVATIEGQLGSGTPGGSVTFIDRDHVLGTASLDGSGHASILIAAPDGFDTFAVVYNGSPGSDVAVSAISAVTPSKVTPTVVLLGPSNLSVVGQTLPFVAGVVPIDGIRPTGFVAFGEAGVILAVIPLDVNGLATFITSSLPPGPHVIEAAYLGDASDNPSLSNFVAQGVLAARGVGISAAAQLPADPLVLTQAVHKLSDRPASPKAVPPASSLKSRRSAASALVILSDPSGIPSPSGFHQARTRGKKG